MFMCDIGALLWSPEVLTSRVFPSTQTCFSGKAAGRFHFKGSRTMSMTKNIFPFAQIMETL